MQNLRLTAHFSCIEGKKLIMEFLDNYDEGYDENGKKSTSRDKLRRMFDGERHPPFDSRTFRVFVMNDPGDDIKQMVGRQVSILVRPLRYSFTSRAEHNRGERISGWKLILETIDLVKQV
jgi:hypothetical protein